MLGVSSLRPSGVTSAVKACQSRTLTYSVDILISLHDECSIYVEDCDTSVLYRLNEELQVSRSSLKEWIELDIACCR